MRLLPDLRVAGRVQLRLRCLEGLLPVRVLLRELRFANTIRRGDEGDAVANEEVEFAVAIDVSDPDPGAMGGARKGMWIRRFRGSLTARVRRPIP